MAFIDLLRETKARVQAQSADPWSMPIARLKGQVGSDRIERISTQAVLDLLEVPQRERKRGTYMRLSKLILEAGWSPIRARDLTRGGFRDQARGYSRTAAKVAP